MIIDIIKKKLSDALAPIALHVIDESYKHAGHAGIPTDSKGETHFYVSIVSPIFVGMSAIKRHQKIYHILSEELKSPIHALALKTLTPDEYIATSKEA